MNASTKNQHIKELLKRSNAAADQEAEASSDEIGSLTVNLEAEEKKLEQLTSQRNNLEKEISVTLVMNERSEIHPTHIRIRGAYDQLGAKVQRNTPTFLSPM